MEWGRGRSKGLAFAPLLVLALDVGGRVGGINNLCRHFSLVAGVPILPYKEPKTAEKSPDVTAGTLALANASYHHPGALALHPSPEEVLLPV